MGGSSSQGQVLAATDSDRLAECACSSVQTVTDLDKFKRCKVDALLLHVSTRPLTDSLIEKALQLPRHLLNHVGEVGS